MLPLPGWIAVPFMSHPASCWPFCSRRSACPSLLKSPTPAHGPARPQGADAAAAGLDRRPVHEPFRKLLAVLQQDVGGAVAVEVAHPDDAVSGGCSDTVPLTVVDVRPASIA